MYEYDPGMEQAPEEWNALDDEQRLELVRQYHERFDADLPDVELHSVFHTVVENQVSLGDEIPVAATLDRLKSEGLDRHDAIHAIASVLATYLHEMLSGPDTQGETEQYFAALAELTADSWWSQLSEAD